MSHTAACPVPHRRMPHAPNITTQGPTRALIGSNAKKCSAARVVVEHKLVFYLACPPPGTQPRLPHWHYVNPELFFHPCRHLFPHKVHIKLQCTP